MEVSCTNNNTLEKRFFAVAVLLKVCEPFFSDRVKKLVVCFGFYESSFYFERREEQITAIFEKLIYFSIFR